MRIRRLLIGMSQEKTWRTPKDYVSTGTKYEKGSNRVSASRLHQVAKVLKRHGAVFLRRAARRQRSGFRRVRGADAISGALQSPEGVQWHGFSAPRRIRNVSSSSAPPRRSPTKPVSRRPQRTPRYFIDKKDQIPRRQMSDHGVWLRPPTEALTAVLEASKASASTAVCARKAVLGAAEFRRNAMTYVDGFVVRSRPGA